MRTSKGSADETTATEDALKVLRLHKKRFSLRDIEDETGISRSAAGRFIKKYREENRKEGILDCRTVMLDEADSIRRGTQILEELDAESKEYVCKGCADPIVCKCGKPALVRSLTPGQRVKVRESILRHGESLRILVGADAAKRVVIEQEVTTELKGLLEGVMIHKPEIMDDLREVLKILGLGETGESEECQPLGNE